MKHVICSVCGGICIKYGKNKSGTQRWFCSNCSIVITPKIDNSVKQLQIFLRWLFGRKTQKSMSGEGRTFRRKTAAFWDIWPMPPIVESKRDVLFVDGIYLGRKTCILVCCDEEHVLGWYLCRYEHAAAWIALMSSIAEPSDICLVLDDANNTPKDNCIKKYIYVELNRTEQSRYKMMAEELQTQLDENSIIKATDSSTAISKLIQLASGTVYDDNRTVLHFHEKKVDVLKQLLLEIIGKNILVTYWFKHELTHIQEAIPVAREIRSRKDIDDWNNGMIPIGVISAALGGRYGDLKDGGNIIIWFSMVGSLNLYRKTNERIASHDRPSEIIHLITKGTIDEQLVELLDKNKSSNRNLLKAIRKECL